MFYAFHEFVPVVSIPDVSVLRTGGMGVSVRRDLTLEPAEFARKRKRKRRKEMKGQRDSEDKRGISH